MAARGTRRRSPWRTRPRGRDPRGRSPGGRDPRGRSPGGRSPRGRTPEGEASAGPHRGERPHPMSRTGLMRPTGFPGHRPTPPKTPAPADRPPHRHLERRTKRARAVRRPYAGSRASRSWGRESRAAWRKTGPIRGTLEFGRLTESNPFGGREGRVRVGLGRSAWGRKPYGPCLPARTRAPYAAACCPEGASSGAPRGKPQPPPPSRHHPLTHPFTPRFTHPLTTPRVSKTQSAPLTGS